MNFDQLLSNLPTIGPFVMKTYTFWRTHVALANTTHVVLGAGLTMALFSRRKKLGFVLILAAAIMHAIAFLR